MIKNGSSFRSCECRSVLTTNLVKILVDRQSIAFVIYRTTNTAGHFKSVRLFDFLLSSLDHLLLRLFAHDIDLCIVCIHLNFRTEI
jgi:hypothetical protein